MFSHLPIIELEIHMQITNKRTASYALILTSINIRGIELEKEKSLEIKWHYNKLFS